MLQLLQACGGPRPGLSSLPLPPHKDLHKSRVKSQRGNHCLNREAIFSRGTFKNQSNRQWLAAEGFPHYDIARSPNMYLRSGGAPPRFDSHEPIHPAPGLALTTLREPCLGTFVVVSMSDQAPPENSSEWLIRSMIIVSTLSFAFLTMRFFCKVRYAKNFSVDDGLLAVAWVRPPASLLRSTIRQGLLSAPIGC